MVISAHKKKYKSLENIIDFAAKEGTNQFTQRRLLINSGTECTRYFRQDFNLNFEETLIVKSKNSFFEILTIQMKMGIKVVQSRLTIDRSTNYLYALAVQDCVTKEILLSSKHKKDPHAQWAILSKDKECDNADIVKNGSILVMTMKGYFPKEEMDNLTETPLQPLITTHINQS
ncbi:hypothetical protein AEQ67_13275 [Pseudomonas sp. RIT-PI-q]|uniref:hypothetical protein n=1 Tax=Pseudomonas sp. RIT-PI-q TaxID=1690247 RepID=UPI0006CD1C2F|nr:hypothetical protein [Pseudomonas sp. RIT-PI-q]KPG98321.1 hypothetical protein AEQ67_13275 [Pseudomonas sp. RIT-PI-q]